MAATITNVSGPVLITGGSRGIGFEVAQQFASRSIPVGIVSRDLGRSRAALDRLRSGGSQVVGECADVSVEAEAAEAISRVAEELGHLEAVVCCAGVHPRTAKLSEYSSDLWETILDINLTGTFYTVKHAVQYFSQPMGGSIVLVGSVASRRGFPEAHAYVASKHGLVGLTRSLALELGKSSVRVNLVCPGFVETDMTRSKAHLRTWAEENSPLGHIVDIKDVANTIRYLVSKESSSITGQTISVCGGTTW